MFEQFLKSKISRKIMIIETNPDDKNDFEIVSFVNSSNHNALNYKVQTK